MHGSTTHFRLSPSPASAVIFVVAGCQAPMVVVDRSKHPKTSVVMAARQCRFERSFEIPARALLYTSKLKVNRPCREKIMIWVESVTKNIALELCMQHWLSQNTDLTIIFFIRVPRPPRLVDGGSITEC
jgi:hypothetical protein